jgi:hypothetical protein
MKLEDDMNISGMSSAGILKMHAGVREALEVDDQLRLSGLQPIFGVREFADWRPWSDMLEAELDQRGVKYTKVEW